MPPPVDLPNLSTVAVIWVSPLAQSRAPSLWALDVAAYLHCWDSWSLPVAGGWHCPGDWTSIGGDRDGMGRP